MQRNNQDGIQLGTPRNRDTFIILYFELVRVKKLNEWCWSRLDRLIGTSRNFKLSYI